MGKVRRERRQGRYYVVARDDMGRFISVKRWSPTAFTVRQGVRAIKARRTFHKGMKVTRLTNVIETEDFSKKPRFIRGQINQEIIQFIQNGKVISQTRSNGAKSKKDKKYVISTKHLENRAFMRLAESQGGGYDADEGRELLRRSEGRIIMRRGMIRYARIR